MVFVDHLCVKLNVNVMFFLAQKGSEFSQISLNPLATVFTAFLRLQGAIESSSITGRVFQAAFLQPSAECTQISRRF